MRIVRNEDREPITAPDGSTVLEIVGPPTGTAANQSLAVATVPPDGETTEHFHRRSEELYVFTGGVGRMRLDGEEAEVRAGDTVAISAGARHKVWNTGAEPLVFYCCCSPPYSDEDTVLCE